jgi:hypothetical protein
MAARPGPSSECRNTCGPRRSRRGSGGPLGAVALRDSKDPQGPVLVVTPQDWQAFTATVKADVLGPR